MSKNILKSIWAVAAGFLSVFILSVGTDFILEKIGVFPPQTQGLFVPWMLALALIYRCIYTALGGYITASLAPDRPMRHALILAAIGFVLSIVGSISNWDQSAAWYPILLIILSPISVWFGAKLKK